MYYMGVARPITLPWTIPREKQIDTLTAEAREILGSPSLR